MNVSLESVIELLNELSTKDPEALLKLMENRVPCNDEIVNHPTIQTAKTKTEYGVLHTVGMVGLLNALFPVYNDEELTNFGQISAQMVQGKLLFFETSKGKEI